MIATPCADGKVNIEYLHALMHTVDALRAAGIEVVIDVAHGPGYIGWARNEHVTRFLASDCTHLFFIDSDLCWNPAGALKLALANDPFVVGLYPTKHAVESYPVRVRTLADGRPMCRRDGLVSVTHAPTGFMLLARGVFEMMIEHGLAPEYRDTLQEDKVDRDWFACTRDGDVYWGEDFSFCNKWAQTNGLIWAVPDIDFWHYGIKPRTGNWHWYMTRQAGGSNDPGAKARQVLGIMGSGHPEAAE